MDAQNLQKHFGANVTLFMLISKKRLSTLSVQHLLCSEEPSVRKEEDSIVGQLTASLGDLRISLIFTVGHIFRFCLYRWSLSEEF